MFVNGEPRFPMAYMSYFPQPFRYQQAAEHEIHAYSLSLTLTDKWFNRLRQRVSHNVRGIWRGPDDLDFSVVDRAIAEIVDADPQAIIFPRIFCDSPAWWDQLHPDEVRNISEECPLRQSFSSLRWRSEAADVLRKIVRHVSASPYARHVIGYMLCAGQTEEYGDHPDFTPCAQKQFKSWLREKYSHDEQAIQRLFGREIEAIAIPAESEQQRADCGNFLDPNKSRLTIDYRQFHSDQVVDSAIALCQAVKDESAGRLITGVFYGYTRIWPDWGHLALRQLLASDAVDFLSNPYSSGGTKSHLWVGNRDFHTFTQLDSVAKAGKLFYSETDIRTSQSRWISQLRPDVDPKGEYDNDAWLGPPTVPKSLQLLKAVFAKVLVSGSVNWWFDLWGGWYDHAEILKLFSEMQKVGDASLRHPCKSVAQIAVFLDENSYRYLPAGVSQFGGQFRWVEAQLEQLGKIGAPYDFFLLDDLEAIDASRYRMVVFLNAFALSDQQRRAIQDRCMSHDRWLVWLYAPGVIRDDLSIDNIASLLGMQFQISANHAATKITLDLPGGPLSYDGAAVAPLFQVSQGADASIGHTREGQLVVAEKAGPNCHNLFVAMPPLSWQAMQHFAKRANVHLYSEAGDVVFANESYLAVSTAEPGKRTIRCPGKTALSELLPIGKRADFQENTQFEIEFAGHTCRLWKMEKAAGPAGP